jgi:beta-glucosidase
MTVHLYRQRILHLKQNPVILARMLPGIALSILFAAECCSVCYAQVQPPAPPDSAPKYLQSSLPIEQRIADLLDRMSMEEKASQLDLAVEAVDAPSPLQKKAPPSVAESDSAWGPPGVGAILFNAPAGGIQHGVMRPPRLNIPPLVAVIAPSQNAEDGPALINVSATWDVALARQAATLFAAQQRALGINTVVLPLSQFSGNAKPHEDGKGWLIGSIGRAFVQGLQADPLHSVAAFPAYFPTDGASAQAAQSLHMGEREFRMNLLAPFEPLLREGISLGVVASADQIDGVPTAANAELLRHILRDEWNFAGVVLAAPGSIRALSETQHRTATPAEAICGAINSGIDMQWNDYSREDFSATVSECVREGVISMKTLDRAVGRVLRAKFRAGLFNLQQQASQTASPSTPDVSAQIAAESLTLLRNEDHLLPLPRDAKSILVIDPATAGGATSKVPLPLNPGSLADEMHRLLSQTEIVAEDGKDLPTAVAHAKNVKAVVVLLQDGLRQSPLAGSARTPFPTEAQEALLKAIVAANKHTIVVLEGTRPPALSWVAAHVPAVVEVWSPGKAEASALAKALVGIANPAGRLPMSIPAESREPTDLFPLGFGLSYTTFRYSDLDVRTPEPGTKDDLVVTVSVTNIGKVEGDEVAQLYLHHDISSVQTPDRTLVGFERIHLHPQESRTLTFKLLQHQLAVWSTSQKWSVEPGPYTIFAGGSSAAQLNMRFTMGEPSWVRALPSETDPWIFAPTLETKGAPVAEFAEAYQLAVRVMEYNLRDGLLEAGKGYGTWTRDTSINAWNAASLLTPEVAKRTLWHQTELTADGPVVGGQYWDKVIWIIAACDYARVTGDQAFLATAYGIAQRTLANLRASQLDAQTGLFRGPAVYGDGVAAYPDPPFNDKHGDNVLDYAEGAELETLSTNSVYYGAYRSAAAMGRLVAAPAQETAALDAQAASLRGAIQHTLWLPGENRFAYFRDRTGAIDKTQEALGEALAVLLGVADDQQAHEIFRHATVTPWGVACTWQPYNRYLDPTDKVFGRHNGTIWPFINAFWATAAASVGESSTFAKEFVSATNLSLRSEDFREIYHPYTGAPYGGVQADRTWDSVRHQTWSATGYLRMVYQGLFGMRFEDAGLRLQPLVPASLGVRSITLLGLKYRHAELNLTVTGVGNRILRCSLDGVLQTTALVPSTLTGKHDVEITLADTLPTHGRAARRSPSHAVRQNSK